MNDLPLPDLTEILDALHVVSLPMNVKFRGITHREAALFEGPNGWVEFSPFLEYETVEASNWLLSALEDGWGEPIPQLRTAIPINATMPAMPATQVPKVLASFGVTEETISPSVGVTDVEHNDSQSQKAAADSAETDSPIPLTVKVKVAEPDTNLADDLARLQAVRDVVGSSARVRIDANGKWGLDEAFDALSQLERFQLEYAEQPVSAVEDLARLRERLAAHNIAIKIAADESIRKTKDPLRVAELGAADLIVVKAQPLGGIRRATEIVSQCGLPAVVSSAIDTVVGISLGARLAASLPQLDHACGLGTGSFFVEDVGMVERADARKYINSSATPPASNAPTGMQIIADRVAPDPGKLAKLRADDSRTVWWRERIKSCYRYLQDDLA